LLQLWLSVLIFVLAYVMIIIEKLPRAVVALTGGIATIVLGILSQEQAVRAIDFNTIGLLVGMMIITGITRKSGVFEYLAVKSAKLAGGRPAAMLVALSLVTAVASAFLDNVTTVLLIIPVTFSITDRLGVSPVPFLVAEIMASNIGGTATLIGDPPNIMIGSATHFGFLDFLTNLAVPVSIVLVATIAVLAWFFRKDLIAEDSNIHMVLDLNERELIKEWSLLKKSLTVLALTILGFVFHQALNLESATIALLGAALVLVVTREDLEEALLAVEWPTVFFFVGLFIIVGGLKATGVVALVAKTILSATGGNLVGTGLLVLWVGAILSAFVDNIPFVATMIPLLQALGELAGMPMESLWWALSLGACLGGNGTLIGASANVIVAGIAERYGSHITFVEYLKIGFPLMLLSVVVSTAYLYLVFWR